MDVRITRAHLADLELLQDLAIKTFRETFAAYNSEEELAAFFEEAYSLDSLAAELNHPESETYLLYADKQAVGFIKLNWGQAQTENRLSSAFEIQRLYLLDAFQGKGLGKELFNFAMAKAEASACDWVWLGVWERNFKAHAFYAKFAFEKFGEHAFAVGNKIDIDWLLKKSLG